MDFKPYIPALCNLFLCWGKVKRKELFFFSLSLPSLTNIPSSPSLSFFSSLSLMPLPLSPLPSPLSSLPSPFSLPLYLFLKTFLSHTLPIPPFPLFSFSCCPPSFPCCLPSLLSSLLPLPIFPSLPCCVTSPQIVLLK